MELLISIHKCFNRLYSYIYYKLRKRRLVSFGFSTKISLGSTFEGANKLYPNTSFKGNLGYGSYIGENSSLTADIGRFTSIAPGVECNHGVHPYTYPYVSTSPMFFSIQKQNTKTFAEENTFVESKPRLTIGNDCWIGQNVFIAGGVHIQDGAVVLAGACVVKDVPPYAIVGGVPAKVINYRYDDETVCFLLKIKWWRKDIPWLAEHWRLFNNIDSLKMYYDTHKEEFEYAD